MTTEQVDQVYKTYIANMDALKQSIRLMNSLGIYMEKHALMLTIHSDGVKFVEDAFPQLRKIDPDTINLSEPF